MIACQDMDLVWGLGCSKENLGGKKSKALRKTQFVTRNMQIKGFCACGIIICKLYKMHYLYQKVIRICVCDPEQTAFTHLHHTVRCS